MTMGVNNNHGRGDTPYDADYSSKSRTQRYLKQLNAFCKDWHCLI